MNQGKIIEYIDQGKFVCALCLQDKGNKLHLLASSNREINVSLKRAALISKANIDPLQPRKELIERLKQTEERRIRLKNKVNVKELWELIKDEKENFNNKYLAQLVFGEEINGDHLSALIRALFEDHQYFRLKDGLFLSNSEERVEQIIKQRKDDALRDEWLKQGSAWLKEAQQGRKTEGPACKKYIIQLLIQLALYENDAQDFKHGKELLLRTGISDIREARNILVKLGEWDKDENLDIHRFGIATFFNKKQMDEVALLAGTEINNQGREDLRHLPVVTIDGPMTNDFDDAVSLEIINGNLQLGIHISDVAAVIPPGSILDKAAFERASSLYLPRREIPMFPIGLSQDTLSLKEGCDRHAISLLTSFNNDGELLNYRFTPSIIRVKQNLTYDLVNANIEKDNIFQKMYVASHRLREKRTRQGAINLSLPDLQINFDSESSLSIDLIPQETPSRQIVAEFMILYNWLAASFCRDNQVPILFRTQAEPNERLIVDDDDYCYYVFQQRRKLNPLIIDTTPRPHSILGVDVYTHFTSPIRRYLDLVMQRQIGNFLLDKEPEYNEKGLDEIRMSVEPVVKRLNMLKRNRIRYWILKYLRSLRGDEKLRAIVLYELKSKYKILLTDLQMIADIKKESRITLNPGDHIMVEVTKSEPWIDRLELK